MSHLTARTNRLGTDLVAPLADSTEARVLAGEGDVVTATPAALAAGAGVTAAGAAAVAGYIAEESADS